MICGNCGQETRRIKVIDGTEYCSNCTSMSEAGGPKTDGLLTRNSLRIRTDSLKYEGDFVPPHRYNRDTKKVEPNPDFIKLHHKNAGNFFEKDDLKQYPKLGEQIANKTKKDDKVEFEGSAEQGMKKLGIK